jgi:hypothetical protein
VQAPRRVLVAVEPRLLGDALTTLLAEIGVDDVHRYEGAPIPGRFDLALVTAGVTGVRASLVLTLPDAVELAQEGSGDLRPGTARELLAVLDRLCPAASPRVERLDVTVPEHRVVSG